MSIRPAEPFKTFLFQPKSYAKSPLGKAAMVALSVLFGIATLGTVHLGVGVNFWLKHKASPFYVDTTAGITKPWDIAKTRSDIAEAAEQLRETSGHDEAEEEMVDQIKKLQETIVLKLGSPESKKVYSGQEKAELQKLYAELDAAWKSISAIKTPSRILQVQRNALQVVHSQLEEFKTNHLT